ncbi:MAG: type II toxin-antitoxin system HicA family toxin [Candidatus Lokiarchaeota archaeon]|nr:type II toxin-antitoxin system HicA family toxin [Candidatus Lokiarchaeota archaeon]
MTPKMPPVSGENAIKVFLKLGYETVHQKGSHVRLRHPSDIQRRPLTIPLHKELKPGLLLRILADANFSRDEFLELL